jgi:hypothetical protein
MNLLVRDLIDVPPVETVIRLDEGLSRSLAITSTFVCTSDVIDHFSVLASSFMRDTGKGAFLEGDFGSGKSHFLAALCAWLEDRPGAELLTRSLPALAEYKATNRRILAVDISLVKYRAATPLERIITSSIETALARRGFAVTLSPLSRFRDRLKELLASPGLFSVFAEKTGIIATDRIDQWFSEHSADALTKSMAFLKTQGFETPESLVDERHETFAAALDAVRNASFAGLVIVIDELSEFFRSKPDAASLNEDARTLQLLGELSSTRPLWIVAAVQESIERTGDIASATFRKIKDRYPVRLKLSTLHIRDLIAKRLVRRKENAADHLMAIYDEFRKNFPLFDCPVEQFLKSYPLHPETLALLEGLGELFSQHRGIVDFVHARIAGDPSRGILGILERPANEFLSPDAIFDHFSSRLAEISSLQIYPRHIIPHLDDVINRIIVGEEDKGIARRLMRMLVLYAIHPTAHSPSARKLAELIGCMVAPHAPDANVEFVAKSILDPITGASRFLAKRGSSTGDPLDATYEITVREDHAGNLRQRVEKAISEVKRDDSRIILEPLSELPTGMSWPGPEILRECVERPVVWRQTLRKALVAFVLPGGESQLALKISGTLEKGNADFAVAIVCGNSEFFCRHTAVWRFFATGTDLDALVEFFATRSLARDLHAANPAHAPLIPLVNDTVRRLEPGVRAALLNALYSGSFDSGSIVVDPSAIQVRRFDRLLEAAAEQLLEDRYPRFKEIAPRLLQQSIRLYQRLLDEFVAPGALSLSEARTKGLTEAIETLASPLGIVEVKSGSYRLAPALGEHPFLNYLFSLIRPAGPTPLTDLLFSLRTGPYGVPGDCASFLLAALAQSGVVSLVQGGRALQLDFLSMTSVGGAESIVPGEIISQADRETLVKQCPFLAPQGGWPSFGLRQQREAWQSLIKLKSGFEQVLAENTKRLSATEEFSAFASFDFESLRESSRLLTQVFSQVKISYQAREGLERFCNAWRASGLSAHDIEFVRMINRFFIKFSEKFIFIAHYIRHQSVEHAAGSSDAIALRRDAVQIMLKDPVHLVVPDEGIQLGAAFDLFRQAYSAMYEHDHGAHYEALVPQKLSKSETRLITLFEKLRDVEQLDRPSGLDDLLRETKGNDRDRCLRPVTEELLRSPACGCGFQCGTSKPVAAKRNISLLIEQAFTGYRAILSSSAVVESIKARAFGLRDMDPEAAGRLDKLSTVLHTGAAGPSLVDLLDDRTIAEIGRALSGTIKVSPRRLDLLAGDLSGRRLSPSKVKTLFDAWLGSHDENTLLSIDGGSASTAVSTRRPSWWALLHPELVAGGLTGPTAEEARALEPDLEEQYSSRDIIKQLVRLSDVDLLGFIANEPLHTSALRAAWEMLVNRMVRHPVTFAMDLPLSHHCNPDEAAAINNRLKILRSFAEFEQTHIPNRLRKRIAAAALWADNWSTSEMRKTLTAHISTLESQAADWLTALPFIASINGEDHPFVLILDALPPDVWLEASTLLNNLLKDSKQSWARLDSSPHTVPSLCALFGFAKDRDPMDEFSARGIAYHSIKGDESIPLVDLLPPPSKENMVVVRLNILDACAHNASLPLPAMADMLATVLSRHLPGVLKLCAEHNRRLILTADHGLSWKNGVLSHGRGGVFEETVVRVVWKE